MKKKSNKKNQIITRLEKIEDNKDGLSLIEVLLIVALFTVLMSSAGSIVLTRTTRADLFAKSTEVVDLISRANNYSRTGYLGDVWGIRVLDNHTDCPQSDDCLVLFKGWLYSARNSDYDQFVHFDSGVYLEASEKNEFYFGYLNGWLTSSTGALSEQLVVLKNNMGEQKSVVISPTGLTSFFICGKSHVYDTEGQAYRTVQIGTQCWMAENLNSGTMLASGADTPSDNSIVEKWCYANSSSNCDSYGGLYDWDELMAYVTTEGVQGICPDGWHVPTGYNEGSELDILEDNYPAATNAIHLRLNGSSGFDLPKGGERNNDGSGSPAYYDSADDLVAIWSSTIDSVLTTLSYTHYVIDPNNYMTGANNPQNYGLSLRCIKD
ncbi:hypothetical protein K8R42_00900 [bacterium]|nr:hypothetical protein [bacterium]